MSMKMFSICRKFKICTCCFSCDVGARTSDAAVRSRKAFGSEAPVAEHVGDDPSEMYIYYTIQDKIETEVDGLQSVHNSHTDIEERHVSLILQYKLLKEIDDFSGKDQQEVGDNDDDKSEGDVMFAVFCCLLVFVLLPHLH